MDRFRLTPLNSGEYIEDQDVPSFWTQAPKEVRLLQLYLEDEERILLPLEQISEVVTITLKQILSVPRMGPWVMGAYEWRGEVVWVVDLRAMMGGVPIVSDHQGVDLKSVTLLTLQSQPSGHPRTKGIEIGAVVPEVGEIETLRSDQIQIPPPGLFSPELEGLLGGYVPQSGLPILEVEWIQLALASMSVSRA